MKVANDSFIDLVKLYYMEIVVAMAKLSVTKTFTHQVQIVNSDIAYYYIVVCSTTPMHYAVDLPRII